ncbi:MAG TPA: CHAT domain-containing protein [Candidatus Angelobacter sp.]|nr:CHAT domain-containing protein [Candidatus Angelobacter sp.]
METAERGDRDSTAFPALNWRFRVLRAEVYSRYGKPDRASELLLPTPPPNAIPDTLWRRALAQAWANCQLHKFDLAEAKLIEAGRMAANQDELRAELAYVHGRCEVEKSNLRSAEEDFRQAANAGKVDDFIRAWSFSNLGLCARLSRNYEDSVLWYTKARQAFARLNARPLEQLTSGNLGFVYYELLDLANAKKNSEIAAQMAGELNLPTDQQRWLLNLGRAQHALGERGAAEESYKKALAIPSPPGSIVNAITCLHNLTVMKLAQHQMALAVQYHKEGLALGPSGDNLIDWQRDEAAISDSRGDHKAAEESLLKLLRQVTAQETKDTQPPYRVIWALQGDLARAYNAQHDYRNAEIWFQRSIATLTNAADAMKHAEFSTTVLSNLPVFDDYVAFLIERGDMVKALQVAENGRARTLTQALGVNVNRGDPKRWLSRIQSYLRPRKATILSYFATDKVCYLWAISSSGMHFFRLDVPGPELDSLINVYRQEIQLHSDMDRSPAGKRLFQLLVQPAADLIPKNSRAIIVADSRIYSVNFESLIVSQGDPHYWIDDVAVENASSIDLLIAGKDRKASQQKELLLIGAPVQADPDFPELPNATREMDSVSQYFPANQVKRISGPDATPRAYLSSSPGDYRYIYFATHGRSNALNALDSAIILSRDSDGSFRLFAHDIIDEKPRLNADLVTISACEGAGTSVRSLEGLLGLEWAFLRAGAHHVVAGLWDVDDASLPGLMGNFYRELSQGRSAAEALREAKRVMLHSQDAVHRRPYYWASLQLYTGS